MGVHGAASGKKLDPRDLVNGAILQCVEAATLGMPFEVWKTRMGRHREESTLQAFRAIRARGISTFWSGTSAKMVESASKGAILLFSKEAIASSCLSLGVGEAMTGFIAGAGAGVCQTVVMGPCTFLVTGIVNNPQVSTVDRIKNVMKAQGIKGFYPGGTAIALRQASNWALRQGLTDSVRVRFKLWFHGSKDAKLTIPQEILAGTIGGALSTINQPFEVARIEMQSAADRGEKKRNIGQVFSHILKEQGPKGLFKGIIPRIGLGVWQTLFMVTGAKLVKQALDGGAAKH